MKIIERTYICPKCKKTYTHAFLASYNSRMANAAEGFKKNHKNTETCPDCNVRVVSEESVEFFDNNGDYCRPMQEFDGNITPTDRFSKFTKFDNDLNTLLGALHTDNILIEGFLDKEPMTQEELAAIKNSNDKENLICYILVSAATEGGKVPLYKINFAKIRYAFIGDRYNSFYIEHLASHLKNDIKFLSKIINGYKHYKVKTSLNINFSRDLLSYKS